jgi:DNA-binding NarL/FixJ family response regulator
MARTRVILADDHKIVTEGLRVVLEPEFELLCTVEDGRALVAEAEARRPDVIVADISMPLLNGIDAVQQLRKSGVRSKVIFLTMHADASYANRAFEVGGQGFVLKHSAPDELVTAIREVAAGRTYVTPRIAGDLLQAIRRESSVEQDSFQQLTPRQREVLQLLAEGRSAREAGDILHISQRTVEFHKYRIMQTLNLKTNADLVQYAIRQGLVAL